MKNKFLIDIIDYYDEITEDRHELSGTFTDQEGHERVINILNDNMFKTYFEDMFFDYKLISIRNLTAEEVKAKFNNFWNIFIIEEKENLNKLCAAYYWDYVPVYNYDRTEEWIDVKTGSEDDDRTLHYGEKSSDQKTTGAYSDIHTPTGSIQDQTTNGAATRTDSVATMDDSNFHNANKSETSQVINTNVRSYNQYQEETERTFNNYNVNDTEGEHENTDVNVHTYNEVTDTHKAKIYGNIGVTTNAQMIQGEFETRVHALGYEFLKRFFDKFFIML